MNKSTMAGQFVMTTRNKRCVIKRIFSGLGQFINFNLFHKENHRQVINRLERGLAKNTTSRTKILMSSTKFRLRVLVFYERIVDEARPS